MQEQDENKKSWSIEIGLYPGVLFGVRTYNDPDRKIHVLYLPFIDIAFYMDDEARMKFEIINLFLNNVLEEMKTATIKTTKKDMVAYIRAWENELSTIKFMIQ